MFKLTHDESNIYLVSDQLKFWRSKVNNSKRINVRFNIYNDTCHATAVCDFSPLYLHHDITYVDGYALQRLKTYDSELCFVFETVEDFEHFCRFAHVELTPIMVADRADYELGGHNA